MCWNKFVHFDNIVVMLQLFCVCLSFLYCRSLQVRTADIAHARNDKLMKALRKTLRQKHGWPKEGVGVLPKPW